MDNTSAGHSTVTDDQYFLLYFVMGVYFAPDLKKVRTLKSVFQRRAEGLRAYLPRQLSSSHMRREAIEGVYYYVLRKTDKSLVLELPQLHQFFNGNLPAPAQDSTTPYYPQFDSLFPPKLHPKSQFRNKYEVLGSIAFVHDPEISYIKPVDIARFKRLTGLKGFLLDRNDPLLNKFMRGSSQENIHEGYVRPSSVQTQAGQLLPCGNRFDNASAQTCNTVTPSPESEPSCGCDTASAETWDTFIPSPAKHGTVNELGQRTIFLPSCPSQEEWNNIVAATKCGISLAGTAARGRFGPSLGLIDIGESDDSYLFRVSLPGVKRDESK